MKIFQIIAVVLIWMFLAGCASTEKQKTDIALAEQKLAEFAPRLDQLHEGMSRAEVERIVQPDRKRSSIFISGFMYSPYLLSPEIRLGLHYFSNNPAQESGEWPTDLLMATESNVLVLIKTPSGRETWVQLSITTKPRMQN